MASERAIRRFFEACQNGEMDIIESIISTIIDINLVRELPPIGRRYTPLQAAINIHPWSVDVVTKLLLHQSSTKCQDMNSSNVAPCPSCGADVDQDVDGWNALDLIPFQEHIASLLLDCSKLGINRTDCHGQNYLWSASTLEATRFLVQNGNDVNCVSNDNQTPLGLFADDEIIVYLKQHGAKYYNKL